MHGDALAHAHPDERVGDARQVLFQARDALVGSASRGGLVTRTGAGEGGTRRTDGGTDASSFGGGAVAEAGEQAGEADSDGCSTHGVILPWIAAAEKARPEKPETCQNQEGEGGNEEMSGAA